MFFGGGGRGSGGRGGRPGKQKGQDVVHSMKVTLEQLYNGATKKLAINREVIDQSFGVSECNECNGRGVVIRVMRMGPMIQQTQSACSACKGEGSSCKN
jgi:DnaJ homolog subfamily A member 2